MLLQLRLRERKSNPPSFLTLLNEIREEEDQQSVRHKTASNPAKPVVRQVRLEDEASPTDCQVQDLRAQMDELRSQVVGLTAGQLKTTPESKPPKVVQTEKGPKQRPAVRFEH